MTEQPTRRVDLRLAGPMRFEAENLDKAKAVLDAAPPLGESSGLSPMELLLAALGGCTGMDVISILRKKRQEVTDYCLSVEGVKATDYPQVFTQMSVHHVLTGPNIREDAVQRAIELSEEKYCSVMAMLRQAAKITTSFEIRSAEHAEEERIPAD